MGPESTSATPPSEASATHARRVLLAAIGVVLLVALFPLLHTGHTVPDDFGYAIWAHDENRWKEAWKTAQVQGRFSLAFHIALNLVPHAVDGRAFLKAVQLGSMVAAVLLFGCAVARLTRHAPYGLLAVLLFAAFLPNMWEHHIYAAYPFVFQFGISAFILSLLAFARGIDDPAPGYRVLSGVLLFLALLTYEAFLPLALVFAVMALGRRTSTGGRATMSALVPPAAAVLGYLLLYAGWRAAFPAQYEGGQIATADADISRALQVVWQFSSASLPGYVLLHFSELHQRFAGSPAGFERTLGSLLANLRVEWLVKALAVGLGIWVSRHLRRPALRLHGPLLVAALLFLLPPLPLALTPKYQQWVAAGAQAYVVTYFSYFGVILALAALPAALPAWSTGGRRWRVGLGLVAVLAALGSLATDFGNAAMHRSQRLYAERWRLFDALVASADMKEVEAGSCVLVDGLTAPLAFGACNTSYWQLAAQQATGRSYSFSDRREDLAACVARGTPAFLLRFRQTENTPSQFLVLARVTTVDQDQSIGERAVVYSSGLARRLTLLAAPAGNGPPPVLAMRIDGRPVTAGARRVTYDVDTSGSRGEIVRTEVAMPGLRLDSLALIARFD